MVYNGKYDAILGRPKDESLLNQYAISLLAYRDHYDKVNIIKDKFDLELFQPFQQPHFKSVSFLDNDAFVDYQKVLEYLKEQDEDYPEFIISDKETDSAQCYFVLLIKGV